MYFWIVLGVVAVLLGIALKPMASPRRFGLEKEFDLPAAAAYDRMARGLIFGIERRLASRELKKLKPHGTLLDAGCGPGYLLKSIRRQYPELSPIGLDINSAVISLALRNLSDCQVRLVRAAAESIPLGSESIDIIISTGTLHHWHDVNKVLQEFYRLVKPGGTLFLMDLRRDCPHMFYWLIWISHWFMPTPTRQTNGPRGSYWASYTAPEIKHILSASPFQDLSVKVGLGWYFVLCKK